MVNMLDKTQKQILDTMAGVLNNAEAIITKSYLDKLETYDLVEPVTEDTDIDIASCGKFFKLSKLIINKEENFLDKLTTIVNLQ